MNHKEYIGKIKQFEEKLSGYDEKIQVIFEYLKQLEQSKQEEVEFKDRKRIGFSRTDET